jgi:hypothetical protein
MVRAQKDIFQNINFIFPFFIISILKKASSSWVKNGQFEPILNEHQKLGEQAWPSGYRTGFLTLRFKNSCLEGLF